MGALLASLTLRARCLLAAGASAVFWGMALGEADLIRAGAVVIALPVICLAIVARTRVTIEAARTVSPGRVAVGETVGVTLRLANRGMLPTGGLLVEDSLPTGAAADGEPAQARFSLGTLQPTGMTMVEYPLPPLPRGRHRIGPLRIRLADPLGMVELVRTFAAATEVIVVPRIVPLPGLSLPGGHEELGADAARTAGATGADDLTVRPYRPGDDLRRIHWRSSARTDELMVRQEHRPWQGEVTVVVDTRAAAHRGSGADSSFEWLVSAAASIAEHLSDRGQRVRLVSDGFAQVWPATGGADSLADLQLDGGGARPSHSAVRYGAALALSDAGAQDAGTVIALIGMPSQDLADLDAAALEHIRGRARILLAVQSSTWDPRSGSSDAASRGRDAAVLRALSDDGWHVARASRGDSVAGAWLAAMGPGDDPRQRAVGDGWWAPASAAPATAGR